MSNDKGYLKISVSEAGGTIPIKGASVIISEYGNGSTTLYSLITNDSGLTKTVSLDAPSQSESLTPGSYQPYSLYTIDVYLDGYYPIESVGVPIFAGITSIQPFNLIPLSEEEMINGTEDGRIMIYETPKTGTLAQEFPRDELGQKNGTISGGIIPDSQSREEQE